MAETLILDPTSEDAANAQLDITGTGYGLLEHHYPQPPIVAQWATSVDTEGSQLGSVKHDNRQISITLSVDTVSALRALQAKLGKLHREGGTLKRTLNDATVVVFDVLTVEGYDPDFSYSFDLANVTTVPFTLTCLPYGRGAEADLGDNVETTLPSLVFTETVVAGDMPALGRLVIDNDVAATQGLVVWGQRSRYYSSASTAALFYEAESCAMVTAAAAVGPAGASGTGSNVARHSTIAAGSYAGLTYIGASSTAQTHIGGFRVFVRTQLSAANPGTVSLRCAWQPYVGATIINNDPVAIEDSSAVAIEGAWVLADLGEVRISKAKVGTQGWLGKIEATATHPNPHVVDLDWIILIPIDEGSGQSISYASTGKPLIASGSIVIRYDGVLSSQTGGYWSKPASYEGDYLRVPPSGAEARTVQVIVKMARGVTGATVTTAGGPVHLDPNTDDLSARLFVTPRYLAVPS